MAFSPPTQNPPAALGALVVILKTRPTTAEEPAVQSAHFQVDVLDANGRRITQLQGNLVPHLTQAQINSLLSFMTDLRAQAEEQILP